TTVLRLRVGEPPPARPVAYAGMEDLTVNAASVVPGVTFGNGFDVKSTSIVTTLNGGSGFRDVFNVGNNSNSLDDIQGALTINGQGGNDSLELFASGDGNANSYTITSTSVARAGAALITYNSLGAENLATGLELFAGAFDDAVAVRSTALDAPVQ